VPLELQGFGPDFINDFRKGEERAFDKVFRTYLGPLTFYACEFVKDEKAAEDIVQDCFEQLWQRRKKLDHIRSINSYLYRCVFNQSYTYTKKRKGNLELFDVPDELIERKIAVAETMVQVQLVMGSLPERMKQVVQLYYLEEKSLAEIGDALGIDPDTVRSHRYRAIQLLRKTITST
jgi:RNA polymerase sigma-70 factor (ECF subfamily)